MKLILLGWNGKIFALTSIEATEIYSYLAFHGDQHPVATARQKHCCVSVLVWLGVHLQATNTGQTSILYLVQ